MFNTYILVGGVATAFHYATLLAMVEVVHFAPTFATMIGAVVGAIVAYAGNRRFTFSESMQSHQVALPRFLLLAALGSLMNGAIIWLGSDIGGLHYFLSQILATGLTLFVTFKLNRLWTFR
jgi:putative flippase GtrA